MAPAGLSAEVDGTPSSGDALAVEAQRNDTGARAVETLAGEHRNARRVSLDEILGEQVGSACGAPDRFQRRPDRIAPADDRHAEAAEAVARLQNERALPAAQRRGGPGPPQEDGAGRRDPRGAQDPIEPPFVGGEPHGGRGRSEKERSCPLDHPAEARQQPSPLRRDEEDRVDLASESAEARRASPAGIDLPQPRMSRHGVLAAAEEDDPHSAQGEQIGQEGVPHGASLADQSGGTLRAGNRGEVLHQEDRHDRISGPATRPALRPGGEAGVRIIPVIDLRGGRAVTGAGGERRTYRPVRSRLFDRGGGDPADPLALVSVYRREIGATWIYVADLDRIEDTGANDDRVAAMLDADPGLRLILDAGARRAGGIPGAPAAARIDPIVATETLDSLAALEPAGPAGDRAILGVDLAATGLVARAPDIARMEERDLLREAERRGFRRALLLALARVGTYAGPPRERLRRLRDAAPGMELLAGGGVRGIDDLIFLRECGFAGALQASALHDGRIAPSALRDAGFCAAV